jgi:hypothetical protein
MKDAYNMIVEKPEEKRTRGIRRPKRRYNKEVDIEDTRGDCED